MIHRYLMAETLKLRRSLALLLCISAPSCVVALSTMIYLGADTPRPVFEYATSSASLWAFVMIPLTATALSVLIAQMEHVPNSWLHLLTMPGARPDLYLAKALVMIALIAAMSALLWVEVLLGASLITALRSDMTADMYPGSLALLLSRITAAAILVAMLQLWVALRFKSFVPPLMLGIAGTFLALVANASEFAVYFPWLLPGKIMSAPPELQGIPLLLGSLGGLTVMLAMLFDLSRRQA